MPTKTSTSAIGISSHFRRGLLFKLGTPSVCRPPLPAAGSPSRRSARGQQRLGQAVATGDDG